MFEFNPDGSIKLPSKLAAKKASENSSMHSDRCIMIKKEIVSDRPPKSCALNITLSDRMPDSRLIESIYSGFDLDSKVPSKIIKMSEKEFRIEIGTCFSRCSDCSALISRFKEELTVIEQQGSCTFKGRSTKFCYEDCFD